MTYKKEVGDFGERLTAEFLEKNGYKILERNYLKPFGEVDIIAQKGELLVFVEVKTRRSSSFAYASESVDYYKQQRVIRASQAYIVEKNLGDFFISFDVSEVYLDTRKINYIENAYG